MIQARGLVQTFHTKQGRKKVEVQGRRRRRPRRRRGRGRRLPRAQRRRQDHHAADADHAAAPDGRHGDGGRLRRGQGVQAGTPQHRLRLPGRRCLLLRPGRRRGRRPRHALRAEPGPGHQARPGALRAARPAGAVAAHAQADVRRPEAAPRHRDGPGPRPDADLPRRAHHRARPAGPGQPLGAHRQAAQRARRDGLPDHALPRRGRRAQRPDHDHRPGQDHRQRHRREPQGGRLRRPGRPRGGRPDRRR